MKLSKEIKNPSECYVVLGHLMNMDGSLQDESKARVMKLISLLKNKKKQSIFFCGWDYRSDSKIKIGDALKSFFIKNCDQIHSLYVCDLSRDTVGDAIFLKHMFQETIKDKLLHIITSDYHCDRANKIFNFVFFGSNKIFLHSANTNKKNNQMLEEEKSLKAFTETFKNISPGDFNNIISRLILSHPYYNGETYPQISIK
jgi:hypothetical protein